MLRTVVPPSGHPIVEGNHARMTPSYVAGFTLLDSYVGIRRSCAGCRSSLCSVLIMWRRLLTAHAVRVVNNRVGCSGNRHRRRATMGTTPTKTRLFLTFRDRNNPPFPPVSTPRDRNNHHRSDHEHRRLCGDLTQTSTFLTFRDLTTLNTLLHRSAQFGSDHRGITVGLRFLRE